MWGGSGIRAATSTVFSQDLGAGKLQARLVVSGIVNPVPRILYNSILFNVSKITQNYLSYFSFNFFQTTGAYESTYGMVPGIGVLSVIEVLGLILCIISTIKKNDSNLNILWFWLLVAPIPAAISVGPGNAANRAAIFMPAVQILSAIGIAQIIEFLANKVSKKVTPVVISTLFLVNLLILFRYSIEQPLNAGQDMMYGMRNAFLFLRNYPDKHIILSDSLSEAHIYAMFYDPIAPNLAQLASKNWDLNKLGIQWVDQQGTYFIGRYTITQPQISRFKENTMVLARPNEIPEGVSVIKTIYTPDYNPILVIAEKI